jgi:UPF0755 protein
MAERQAAAAHASWVKRGLGSAAGLALVALIVAGVIWAHYQRWASSPIPGLIEERVVVIPAGTGFGGVMERLEESHLVTRPWYFRWLARQRGVDRRVQPGTYRVPEGTTPQGLLVMLGGGGADDQVRLVVPEGFNIFQLGDRLEALGLANRERFLARVRSEELRTRYGLAAGDSLEGYLFPDTYLFKQGTPLDVIIDRMVQRHREIWAALLEEVGPGQVQALQAAWGLEERELITLASIVEKEAIADSERPIIARVFYNRLTKGMKLQTDPTCVYSEARYLEKPHPRSCKDATNRYSTYVIAGLPPGPIANPGRSSLRAVLSPSGRPIHKNLLYFVARPDGSGRHTFSATYEEHLKATREAFGR